jgi:hypothetical protein
LLNFKNLIINFFILTGVISIILIIFGALVLIFSLIYFARYADKNFKKMMEDNKNKNQENSFNTMNDESIDSRLSTGILEVPLNNVDNEGNKL